MPRRAGSGVLFRTGKYWVIAALNDCRGLVPNDRVACQRNIADGIDSFYAKRSPLPSTQPSPYDLPLQPCRPSSDWGYSVLRDKEGLLYPPTKYKEVSAFAHTAAIRL
jgi:hypothetical protein